MKHPAKLVGKLTGKLLRKLLQELIRKLVSKHRLELDEKLGADSGTQDSPS
jgi:hypothetical protein